MITKKDSTKDLTHQHAGNGLAVVQWLDDDYCRVTGAYAATQLVGPRRVYLAWTKKLSPTLVPEDPHDRNSKLIEVPIPPVHLKALAEISKDLSSGKAVVRDTKLIYV